MSGLFPHREHTDPWFRIGRLEVNTTMFVVLAVIVSWLSWVVVGPNWTSALAYSPQDLATAQVWRIFTWPFAGGLSFLGVVNLFFFWYFGTELEGQIGRLQMAGLLVGIWGSLTVSYSVIAVIFASPSYLVGIGLIEFLLLLLWIAEYPRRPLFFGIPAWVFGVVIVAVDVLVMVANRDIVGLLSLLLSLTFVAISARRSGLLREYSWIPGQGRLPRPPKKRVKRAQVKATQRRASDQERMDALLDQINDQGLHSLTPAQRKELKTLSDRRRKG